MTHSLRIPDLTIPARPDQAGWPAGVGPGDAGDPAINDVDVIRVRGDARLAGTVHVVGAKNSALKLMAAALLAPGRSMITNVPRITDIAIMGEVLRRLGCGVRFGADDPVDPMVARGGVERSRSVVIDVPERPGAEADYDLVRRLRASICVLGPLLARRGYVRVAHPGGDAIGSRGLDMHISGLTRMGAAISGEHGFVIASAPDGLHGADIVLDFPSVGATENLVMAAVLARGVTVIDNAAREPEIVDICSMLIRMGARIEGRGPRPCGSRGSPSCARCGTRRWGTGSSAGPGRSPRR